MTEDAKLRFLFKKIDHQGLSKTVEAMKTNIVTEALGVVTYTTVANHLSTAVSELPNYLARNRNISVVGQGRGGGGGIQRGPGPHHGIFSADGSIHTGHYPNWSSGMDIGDKLKGTAERQHLCLGRKHQSNARNNQKNPNKGKFDPVLAEMANDQNQFIQLKAANEKCKCTIASLKSIGSEDTPSNDVEMSDAGDAFGGKSKKARN